MIQRFTTTPTKTGVKIHLDDLDKEMEFPVSMEEMLIGIQLYHAGAPIQSAFSFLNPDQREFLMTGITPTEWEEIFGEEEE